MKILLSLIYILLISSCGKKSEGSNPFGVSPLLPAPVSNFIEDIETDELLLLMLEDVGIRIQDSSNSPAVIICIDTKFSQKDKIEDLKNYFITINDNSVPSKMQKQLLNNLIPKAIESLSKAPLDSKKCPKTLLAIE